MLLLLLLLLLLAWNSTAEPLTITTSFQSNQANQISFTKAYIQLDQQQELLRIILIGNALEQSTGYSPQTNFLATLITETAILNFQSTNNQSALCESIRTPTNPNKGCPYGPGQIALGVQLPIPSLAHYPFITIKTQLQLLDSSTPPLNLASIQINASPHNSNSIYLKLLSFIPITIIITYLIISCSARLWAAIISEQLNREAQAAATISSLHPTHYHHHHITLSSVWWLFWSGQTLLLSGPLLRFSTPATSDILNHLQFISLIGLISVQWPDFIYPILTQSAWSTLIFNNTLFHTNTDHPNPLTTPPYDPPQAFVTQFDTPTSPLYLDRNLPNLLLNYPDDLPQGLPRWATTIGIIPHHLFGVAISVFAICCALIALFSALSYLLALISTLIYSLIHSSQSAQPDSAILTNNSQQEDVDDGQVPKTTPTTINRLFHPSSKSQPDNNNKHSLVHSIFSDHGLEKPSSSPWPPISHHFALLQGNLLRLFILFYLPLVVFSSYQLTLIHTAPTVTVIIAACVLAACAIIPIVQLCRLRNRPTQELIDTPTLLLTLGPLYNMYDDHNRMFMGVRFASSFIVGLVIGTAQSHGIVQAVVLLVAELTETMLTSLWLPWGDGAAMAPLTFICSVSRIITAVILVVMTPVVGVGSLASGWLAYVVLLVLGGILAILFCVLLVKLVELLLRLVAHIPFDETRSTRAGGLRGAWRRWDRTASRSSRHGRAAAIAARRHRRRLARRKSEGSTKFTLKGVRRASVFSTLNSHHHLPSPSHGDKSTAAQEQHQASSLSPGFVTMNDEDGNIMSAMSQGPWVRPPVSEAMYGSANSGRLASPASHPVGHQSLALPPMTGYPSQSSAPSSGFAVVRGGRATEKTPYQMHNDGRNSWRAPRLPHDYPPSHNGHHHDDKSPSLDFSVHHSAPPVFYQANNTLNGSRTTTNLFENTPFPLSSSSDQSSPRRPRSRHDAGRHRPRRSQAKKATGILGIFRRGRGNPSSCSDSSSSSSSSSCCSSSSSSEDSHNGEEWDAGNGPGEKGTGRGVTEKLRGIMGGLGGRWRREKQTATPDEQTPSGSAGPANTSFHVVRQPRPRPPPATPTDIPENSSLSQPDPNPSDHHDLQNP
ncbi:hypothetical protein VP01_466g6 [Puccinia sorghi]|uniref:TRP C-terminal domain-containing protein n=1 Tax=Puccinia sorghi TaxID=27349 RepID=A0A0L6UN55_9BASI|nr:hypothetical protein VP01_466g6 [Puccinia sorghi]